MSSSMTVSFAFYTGMGKREPFLNRLTSYFTGKYMHCEIVFSDRRGHEACGIWQNEPVFLRPKRFGKKCWRWIALCVTKEQYKVMYYFCKEQARLKIPFNKYGFYRCVTPFPRKTARCISAEYVSDRTSVLIPAYCLLTGRIVLVLFRTNCRMSANSKHADT